mgnify:CR=1
KKAYISLILDVSDFISLQNSTIFISEDWKISNNNDCLILRWGDLSSIGCEILINEDNLNINLDRFSCFPIFYLRKKNIIFLTSLWEDIR